MKISSLFTPAGLCQALKEHHKNLSQNHNFPSLTGAKPLHRFAELFDLKNAEELEDRLSKIAQPDLTTLGASLNLVNQKAQAQVHCYFEAHDNTVRVHRVNQPSLFIATLKEMPTTSPYVHYLSTDCALITYENIQFHVFIHETTLVVELNERNHPARVLNKYTLDTETNPIYALQPTEELKPMALDDNASKPERIQVSELVDKPNDEHINLVNAIMGRPFRKEDEDRVRLMLTKELTNALNTRHFSNLTVEQVALWLTPDSTLKEIAFFFETVNKNYRSAITDKTILSK